MKAIIDLKLLKNLENGDILVYRDGSWVNIPKDEYLIEIEKCQKQLNELDKKINELNMKVKELRGED